MTEDIFNKKGQNNSRHPLYKTWYSMKSRCRNEHDKRNYGWYGGRGITVCDRWLDGKLGFFNFVNDMGPKPEGYSIDRINVNGPYSPENCRWASSAEQSMNKRNNVHVDIGGESLSPRDISGMIGVPEETIRCRIRRGKSGSDLLSPLGNGSPRAVRCIETGEEFKSLAEASRAKGVHKNSLWSVLRGPSKTAGGLHWEYAGNADEVYEEIKRLI